MRNGCVITSESSGKITDTQLTCRSMEQSIQHLQARRVAQHGKKRRYTLGLVTWKQSTTYFAYMFDMNKTFLAHILLRYVFGWCNLHNPRGHAHSHFHMNICTVMQLSVYSIAYQCKRRKGIVGASFMMPRLGWCRNLPEHHKGCPYAWSMKISGGHGDHVPYDDLSPYHHATPCIHLHQHVTLKCV